MSSSFLALAIHANKSDVVAHISDYVLQRDGLFRTCKEFVEYDQYTCKNKRLFGLLEKKIAILYIKAFELNGWTILLDDFDNSWDYASELLNMAAVLSVKLETESCFINIDDEVDLMHCAQFERGEVLMQCKRRYDLEDLYEENISVRVAFERLQNDNPHNWTIMTYEEYLKLPHGEQNQHYPRLCLALLAFDLYNFCTNTPDSHELFQFASN